MSLVTFDDRIAKGGYGFGTIQTISLPFTATSDGILIFSYKKSSNGVWYHYMSTTGYSGWRPQFSGYTNNNYIDTRLFPIKKGQTIKQESISGVSISTIDFIPIGEKTT